MSNITTPLLCLCAVLAGSVTHASNVETKNVQKAANSEALWWNDSRRAAPSDLQPILPRVAIQEGGDWNGPYSLNELENRLPKGLKTEEYRNWLSTFYRSDAQEYYVISKISPYSFREKGSIVETVGRFPICVVTVSVMQDASYYRRFVFNVTGSDRKVL